MFAGFDRRVYNSCTGPVHVGLAASSDQKRKDMVPPVLFTWAVYLAGFLLVETGKPTFEGSAGFRSELEDIWTFTLWTGLLEYCVQRAEADDM